jgi:hypothetical protein
VTDAAVNGANLHIFIGFCRHQLENIHLEIVFPLLLTTDPDCWLDVIRREGPHLSPFSELPKAMVIESCATQQHLDRRRLRWWSPTIIKGETYSSSG